MWLVAFLIFICVLVTGSLLVATMHMGFGLAWIFIIVLAIYFLASEGRSAKEVLGNRYAHDEISRKQYLQMKKDMK